MTQKKKPQKEEDRKILVAAEEFAQDGKKKAAGGAVAAFLSRLGVGGSSEGVRSLGRDILTSKAGFTALMLVGYTGAISLGMFANYSGSAHSPKAGARVFDQVRAERLAQDVAEQEALLAAGADGKEDVAGSSLDFLTRANKEAAAPAGSPAGAPEDGAVDDVKDAPEVSSGVETPDNRYGRDSSRAASATRPRQRLVASSGISTGGGATGAQVAAGEGLRGASRGGAYLNEGKSAALRHAGGSTSSRKPSAIRQNKNMSASQQALQVKKHMRSSLARSNLSSANSGLPYDGGRGQAGQIGADAAAAPDGTGVGGKTAVTGPNPSTMQDLKDVKPPPKITYPKNKTPYQNLVNAAMIALALSTALMFVAGWLKNKADALMPANPAAAQAMLTKVKIAAGLAAMGAMGAAAIGARLLNAEGQNMQGITFITTGGLLAIRAGMILYDASAAKNVEQDISVAATGVAKGMPLKGGEAVSSGLKGAAALDAGNPGLYNN
ncbi:MAG: hypothetical protein ABIJ96_08735 [Elusimicrobiota bacterium]